MKPLQRGETIFLGQEEYVVDMVNESRARCRPVARRSVAFQVDGVAVSFARPGATVSISPYAEVIRAGRCSKIYEQTEKAKTEIECASVLGDKLATQGAQLPGVEDSLPATAVE